MRAEYQRLIEAAKEYAQSESELRTSQSPAVPATIANMFDAIDRSDDTGILMTAMALILEAMGDGGFETIDALIHAAQPDVANPEFVALLKAANEAM